MAKFDVQVELVGRDGNALAVVAAVKNGLKRAGATPDEIAEFVKQALSGDYNNVLRTAIQWVEVV